MAVTPDNSRGSTWFLHKTYNLNETTREDYRSNRLVYSLQPVLVLSEPVCFDGSWKYYVEVQRGGYVAGSRGWTDANLIPISNSQKVLGTEDIIGIWGTFYPQMANLAEFVEFHPNNVFIKYSAIGAVLLEDGTIDISSASVDYIDIGQYQLVDSNTFHLVDQFHVTTSSITQPNRDEYWTVSIDDKYLIATTFDTVSLGITTKSFWYLGYNDMFYDDIPQTLDLEGFELPPIQSIDNYRRESPFNESRDEGIYYITTLEGGYTFYQLDQYQLPRSHYAFQVIPPSMDNLDIEITCQGDDCATESLKFDSINTYDYVMVAGFFDYGHYCISVSNGGVVSNNACFTIGSQTSVDNSIDEPTVIADRQYPEVYVYEDDTLMLIQREGHGVDEVIPILPITSNTPMFFLKGSYSQGDIELECIDGCESARELLSVESSNSGEYTTIRSVQPLDGYSYCLLYIPDFSEYLWSDMSRWCFEVILPRAIQPIEEILSENSSFGVVGEDNRFYQIASTFLHQNLTGFSPVGNVAFVDKTILDFMDGKNPTSVGVSCFVVGLLQGQNSILDTASVVCAYFDMALMRSHPAEAAFAVATALSAPEEYIDVVLDPIHSYLGRVSFACYFGIMWDVAGPECDPFRN